MWRRILAYCLFGLGLLTVTFFKHYTGEMIPHPFLFWLLGLALFAGGFLFVRYTPDGKDLEDRRRLIVMINDLKNNGEKIQVDLSACEIIEHSYSEEKPKYGQENELLPLGIEREIEGWNTLGGGAWRNVEQVEVMQSVLIYERNDPGRGGTEKFVSRVIPKDKITLSFYLDKQRYTTLYVDRNNRARYYFDLEFLNS